MPLSVGLNQKTYIFDFIIPQAIYFQSFMLHSQLRSVIVFHGFPDKFAGKNFVHPYFIQNKSARIFYISVKRYFRVFIANM